MEEEVLEKYKVEEAKNGAYKGRGEPLEWRIVQKEKRYQPPNWGEDCWARIFSWFSEYSLLQSSSRGEKPQQRMDIMTDMTRKIKAKGRMDAAADCKKASVALPRMGGHHAATVQLAAGQEE